MTRPRQQKKRRERDLGKQAKIRGMAALPSTVAQIENKQRQRKSILRPGDGRTDGREQA